MVAPCAMENSFSSFNGEIAHKIIAGKAFNGGRCEIGGQIQPLRRSLILAAPEIPLLLIRRRLKKTVFPLHKIAVGALRWSKFPARQRIDDIPVEDTRRIAVENEVMTIENQDAIRLT